MNWGIRLLTIWLLLPMGEICAQQLSHQVLVPFAGVVTGGNYNYSQTVGETAVEMVGCTSFILTQGFQQPGIKFSKETQPAGTGVNVYPNPVHDNLTLEFSGESSRTLRIEILNITGTIVFSDKIIFTDKYWYREPHNVESLLPGIYFVRIMSEDGFLNRTFKIEKF
mgnify:CR=1 FL=1